MQTRAESEITERPTTLQSISGGNPSLLLPTEGLQDEDSLLVLPSPISRHGSLVGDPQLPVPAEFLDVSIKINYSIRYDGILKSLTNSTCKYKIS